MNKYKITVVRNKIYKTIKWIQNFFIKCIYSKYAFIYLNTLLTYYYLANYSNKITINIAIKREANPNYFVNSAEPINKSAHEHRRVAQSSLITDPNKLKKQRNHRELTGLRENKQKEALHIHKSFSFKWTSKREK